MTVAEQFEALDAQISEAIGETGDLYAPKVERIRAELQALRAQHPEVYRAVFSGVAWPRSEVAS